LTDLVTDLGGWKVGTEEFLAPVLQTIAQPIWVVDPDGLIRFANPAAISALGYESETELLGRPSHETIHHHYPDGTQYPVVECPMLLPRTTGDTVIGELDWFFRRDGSMFPVSYVSAPIDMASGRGAVVAFTGIEDRLRAERELRERDAILAEEQAALRRVAAVVAAGAASADVFAAVTMEVGQALGLPYVDLLRYESDGTATVIGAWGEREHPFAVGTRWVLDGPTITARVRDTAAPARIDDYTQIDGQFADAVRGSGIRAAAGAPIVVDGKLWGVMVTAATEARPLPDRIEQRLAGFTELVATAISHTQARDDLRRLADEQLALRRVAILVARGDDQSAVFDAVCEETGRLLDATTVNLARFTDDEMNWTMSGWSVRDVHMPTGTRLPLEGDTINALVRRTGAAARVDSYDGMSGELAERLRQLGIRSEVGAPVIVDGRIWGALIAGTDEPEPLGAGAELRLARFAELVATAVSNATARSELLASRARIVAAADEQRQRVVRDLHDGAQQRLVHAVMTLQLAHGRGDAPPTLGQLIADALEDTRRAIDELRELAHGIHPALLTHRGLAAAVEALADRATVPVAVDIPAQRYPPSVESAAYFVAAEALTNVAKYAHAASAHVAATCPADVLTLVISDDGVGGATLIAGRGLSGLRDRVAAVGGTLTVHSPPGQGTHIRADIPLQPPHGHEPVDAPPPRPPDPRRHAAH